MGLKAEGKRQHVNRSLGYRDPDAAQDDRKQEVPGKGRAGGQWRGVE